MGISIEDIKNPALRAKIIELDREQNSCSAMGGLGSASAQHAPLSTLVQGVQEPARGKEGVAIRITLISCRRKLLDAHDNLPYAMKPICDAIAASIGLDDADPRIQWQYEQILTKGEPGVLVHIEIDDNTFNAL